MPSFCYRAIYFAAYSTAKEKLNGVLEPDSTQVHMASAGMAGNVSFSSTLLYVGLFLCIKSVYLANPSLSFNLCV